MIIGLLGEDSNLKRQVSEYLAGKGFEPAQLEQLHRIYDANHHWVSASGSPEELALLRQSKAFLLLVSPARLQTARADHCIFGPEFNEHTRMALDVAILEALRATARPEWDEYFMKIAQVASTRSNCIKRKVGAVIVKDMRIVSTGYNGTVRRARNCNEGGCPRCNSLADSGTNLEACLCSHGEENAIVTAAYHGISVKDATLYTTLAPCLICTKMIINSGIIEVVYNANYPLNDVSFRLLQETGVEVRRYAL